MAEWVSHSIEMASNPTSATHVDKAMAMWDSMVNAVLDGQHIQTAPSGRGVTKKKRVGVALATRGAARRGIGLKRIGEWYSCGSMEPC